jgi:hypothetical protein
MRALDSQNAEIELERLKELELVITDLLPKKKIKVVPNLNERFVQLDQVKKDVGHAKVLERAKTTPSTAVIEGLSRTCLGL